MKRRKINGPNVKNLCLRNWSIGSHMEERSKWKYVACRGSRISKYLRFSLSQKTTEKGVKRAYILWWITLESQLPFLKHNRKKESSERINSIVHKMLEKYSTAKTPVTTHCSWRGTNRRKKGRVKRVVETNRFHLKKWFLRIWQLEIKHCCSLRRWWFPNLRKQISERKR